MVECTRWLSCLSLGWRPKVWPFKWKRIEQFYLVVLFIFYAVRSAESGCRSLRMKSSVTIQMKAIIRSTFLWYCFLMLYIVPTLKLDLIFKPGGIPKVWPCKWKLFGAVGAVLSCGAVCYAVQSGFNFWVCGWNPKVCLTMQMKAIRSSTFMWSCMLLNIWKTKFDFFNYKSVSMIPIIEVEGVN